MESVSMNVVLTIVTPLVAIVFALLGVVWFKNIQLSAERTCRTHANNKLAATQSQLEKEVSRVVAIDHKLSLAVGFIANFVRQADISDSLRHRAILLDDACRKSISLQQSDGDPDKAADLCNGTITLIEGLKRNFFTLLDRANELARELPTTGLTPYSEKSFKEFLPADKAKTA